MRLNSDLNVRFATTLSSSNSSPKAATFSPHFSIDVAQQKQVSLTATPTTQATHQDDVWVPGTAEYYRPSAVAQVLWFQSPFD